MFGESPDATMSGAGRVTLFFELRPRRVPVEECRPEPCELVRNTRVPPWMGVWEYSLCQLHTLWWWRAA